jgi:hypothetical protein
MYQVAVPPQGGSTCETPQNGFQLGMTATPEAALRRTPPDSVARTGRASGCYLLSPKTLQNIWLFYQISSWKCKVHWTAYMIWPLLLIFCNLWMLLVFSRAPATQPNIVEVAIRVGPGSRSPTQV